MRLVIGENTQEEPVRLWMKEEDGLIYLMASGGGLEDNYYLLSFKDDGTVRRCPGVPATLGFELDGGRLKIRR
jgi:hypothetical protein